MKQLLFPEISKSVNLPEPQWITLVIERPEQMRNYLMELFDGFGEKSKRFRLLEDGQSLYLDEHGFFLPSQFNLELNSKRNLNSLLKLLKKSYFENLAESVKDIQARIEEAIEAIRLDFDVEIVSDFDLKTDDLFKIANVKFSEECENLSERLCRYLSVENELNKSTILFTIHLQEYFSEEEIKNIRKELAFRGWTVVDLESRPILSLENEHRFIVDNDLCVI